MTTADCCNCDSEHSLGDREYNGFTTECPDCEGTSYTSIPDGGKVTVSEKERIVNTVMPINHVGDETAIKIAEHFDLYAELERASVEELMEVENVGGTVARKIVRRT